VTDSSTGGFLSPSPVSPPLQGQALLDFIQSVIVGITGLAGSMVRPYWQGQPPNIPDAGDAWCAFQVSTRKPDTFGYERHDANGNGNGSSSLQRYEVLGIMTSFYDLGSGGLADSYCSLLADGLQVAQNREILSLNNMGLIRTGDIVAVPVLFKMRWLYRVDMDVILTRQVDRVYPVLNVTSAQGSIVTDDGISRTIRVP